MLLACWSVVHMCVRMCALTYQVARPVCMQKGYCRWRGLVGSEMEFVSAVAANRIRGKKKYASNRSVSNSFLNFLGPQTDFNHNDNPNRVFGHKMDPGHPNRIRGECKSYPRGGESYLGSGRGNVDK